MEADCWKLLAVFLALLLPSATMQWIPEQVKDAPDRISRSRRLSSANDSALVLCSRQLLAGPVRNL